MATVLLVDDDVKLARIMGRVLRGAGHEVFTAHTGEAALELAGRSVLDVAVVDVRLPDGDIDGLDLTTRLLAAQPGLPVLIVTAYPDYDSIKAGLHLGVFAWLDKPFDNHDLLQAVASALAGQRLERARTARRAEPAAPGFCGLVGASSGMLRVYKEITTLAAIESTVLVCSETGTGKELVARAIHQRSARRNGLFLTVNAAAIADSLFEDAFFGHEAGAFTDARARRAGFLEEAKGGTLFLDEIGELSTAAQAKLLRIFEEREVRRLGSTKPVPVDARFIVATNRDLRAAVSAGAFRADLCHRLEAAAIEIPPLREREGDLHRLIEYYVPVLARELNSSGELAAEALEALMAYGWPGNVRELQNALRKALLSAGHSPVQVRHLPGWIRADTRPIGPPGQPLPSGVTLPEALSDFQHQCILQVLAEHGGNQSLAARRLGIDRKTLRLKLKNRTA